jgi:hypothetical protein
MRNGARKTLSAALNAVLLKHPELNYSQGYNEFAGIFTQIIVDWPVQIACLEQASLYFFKEALIGNNLMDWFEKPMILIIWLLKKFQSPLYDLL